MIYTYPFNVIQVNFKWLTKSCTFFFSSVGEAGAVSWSDVHLPWRRLCRHPMEVESESDLCFSFLKSESDLCFSFMKSESELCFSFRKVKVELSAQL